MRTCFPFFRKKKNSRLEERISEPASTTTRPDSTNGTGITVSTSSSTKQTSKSSASASSPRSIPALYEERGQNLRVFDIRELRIATNNFSRLLKIGEGGFGSVHKGFIKSRDGQGKRITVAIKKLNQDGVQGHKEWLTEVLFLGVVDHPNLVKLIGYCAVDSERGNQRFLVYEFMPNRSLEAHLFNSSSLALCWDTRLKIAKGVAEGLAYLHEGLEVQIIYRDFKASNILLDEDFNPKLSDFGLAREGPSDGQTHVTTAIVGTYGYAAPDYVESGHLTIKSDVWSFGVVLFEILTGRCSLDRNLPKPEQRLLSWVKQFPINSRKFSSIMDPRLEGRYSLTAARLIANLANSCLSKNPKDRPSMSEVVESLKHAIKLTETNGAADASESTTDSESEEKTKQAIVSESAKRRMLHLARLGEHASAEIKRKFAMMHHASSS